MTGVNFEDLDQRDQQIITERSAALDADQGPRVGDWVIFADNTTRRISYIWGDSGDDSMPPSVQTSDGGHYYLGDGYVSMSGSLYSSVPLATLADTGEVQPGSVWIFHHDYHTAGGGIDTEINFRVYACERNAPR